MTYTQLIKTYPRYLGFGFLHTLFSSIGQTFFIALFIPHLRQDFKQSAASLGAYYGMVTLASAATLLVTGPLIDKVNLRLYSVAVGLMVATGCLALGWASALWSMLLGLFLMRHGGQALLKHTATTSMARYFTLARGKALGITGLGIALGEAILPFLLALLLVAVHWRSAYFLLAGLCLLLFIPLSLLLVNKHDDIQHPQSTQPSDLLVHSSELDWGRKQLISHPYFWMLLPMLIMPPFLGTGYFFFQTEIAASKQWSSQLFASTFLAYGLSSALSSFFSGPIVDRSNATRLLPLTIAPVIIGVLFLIYIPGILGGYLFMVSLGVSFGSTGNFRDVMWAEVYGRSHLGAIKSFASMLMVFSTAISPPLGGWLLDKGFSIQTILWGSVWLCAASILLALLARPPHRTK